MRSLIHPFSMVATTPRSYDDAIARTRETLVDEGFGIVSEIDVRETFERQLGVEFEPYLILGACDPTYAHMAIELDPELGTLLPCTTDPERMLSVADRVEFEPVAHALQKRLQRVVDLVATC